MSSVVSKVQAKAHAVPQCCPIAMRARPGNWGRRKTHTHVYRCPQLLHLPPRHQAPRVSPRPRVWAPRSLRSRMRITPHAPHTCPTSDALHKMDLTRRTQASSLSERHRHQHSARCGECGGCRGELLARGRRPPRARRQRGCGLLRRSSAAQELAHVGVGERVEAGGHLVVLLPGHRHCFLLLLHSAAGPRQQHCWGVPRAHAAGQQPPSST